MEEILTAGNKETKLVASKHGEVHPPLRSALSLWRKFASFRRIKRPTGDSNMPEEIQLAKTVWCRPGRKAENEGWHVRSIDGSKDLF